MSLKDIGSTTVNRGQVKNHGGAGSGDPSPFHVQSTGLCHRTTSVEWMLWSQVAASRAKGQPTSGAGKKESMESSFPGCWAPPEPLH